MADAERGKDRKSHKKETAKSKDSKGKPKSRWRKPKNLINIGNKEKGECFSFQFRTLETGNWRLDGSFS